MKDSDREAYIERYNERLEEYGKDPKTLGWMRGRQEIRFEALTGIGDLDGASVLDIGCGFGDLLGFLQERDVDVDYRGWDINPDLVEIAREEYPEGSFETVDVSERDGDVEYDYVFASGVFNHQISDNEAFVRDSLATMVEIADRGVAVDFMSTYVDYRAEDAYYADPREIFDYCKELSMRVSLRHDYLPYEFCVYVYVDDAIDEDNAFEAFPAPE